MPIRLVPEFHKVAAVGLDVIDHCCGCHPHLTCTTSRAHAQRMLGQEVHASDTPAGRAVQRTNRIILSPPIYLPLPVPLCLLPWLGAGWTEGGRSTWHVSRVTFRDSHGVTVDGLPIGRMVCGAGRLMLAGCFVPSWLPYARPSRLPRISLWSIAAQGHCIPDYGLPRQAGMRNARRTIPSGRRLCSFRI